MTEMSPPPQQLTILVADDDPRVLRTFARNLAHAGYQVVTATGGEEALAHYDEISPDITLVDIRMPDVDGLAVLHAIRERNPEAEVILTTGHGDKDLVIAALRAGASDFVSKPIDQVTLKAVLGRSEERIGLRRELHAAQEALEASEARYRRIVQTVPDIITTLDREGTVLFINRPVGSLIEADLIGKKARDFLPPREQETAMQEIERVFETGEAGNFKIKGPRTGAWYGNRIAPVWQDGRVVAATIISTNISDQVDREQGLKAAREALESQIEAQSYELEGIEARFRAVFEAAQDSIFIKDNDLRYVLVNPAMAALFDTPAEELLGRTDTEIFGPTAGEHIKAVDARALQGEIVEEEDTKPVNGVMRTFHVIKAPIRSGTGEIIGLCGIARDITERKEMETQLREYAESLERKVRAEARELGEAHRETNRSIDV